MAMHILFQTKLYLKIDENQGKLRKFSEYANFVMVCCQGNLINVKFVFIF